MMQNLFPGDCYDTPPSSRRDFIDKYLSLGTRWSFYLRNFFIFSRSGECGRKGLLDGEHQVFYSNMNIRLVEKCGGKIHLRGLDNLGRIDGPAMLIGNHMSLLETALFHAIARPRRDFTFVIKESLLRVPFFGNIMRALDAIAVGRENPRDDLRIVLSRGKEILKSGRSIILFPQSTRTVEFDPKKFNTIGIKLARSAGVPIIPFALKTDFLGNGKWLRDMGPIYRNKEIYFEFGEPIHIVGDGKKEHQQIIEFIQQRLRTWNHQA
ncbi:MAG: lysophospholipid acyltransferase family protein [Victivallales bacterium]|nr:lysophospholipid acyltransferase family protein [Victivallales bacterium]